MERHLSTGITTLVALMAADRPRAGAEPGGSSTQMEDGARDTGIAALLGLTDDQVAATDAASRCPFFARRRERR